MGGGSILKRRHVKALHGTMIIERHLNAGAALPPQNSDGFRLPTVGYRRRTCPAGGALSTGSGDGGMGRGKGRGDVHPNVAELSQAEMKRLADNLAAQHSIDECREAIRSLVGEVVLTPGERYCEAHAELRGDFLAILASAGGRRCLPEPTAQRRGLRVHAPKHLPLKSHKSTTWRAYSFRMRGILIRPIDLEATWTRPTVSCAYPGVALAGQLVAEWLGR